MPRRLPHQPAPEGKKSKERGSASAADELREIVHTPLPDYRGFPQVTITLNKAIARALESEAQALNLRRHQLVEMLFLSEASDAPFFSRPAWLGSYKFTRKEVQEQKRFVVVMRPEVKKKLDDYLGRRGLNPSSWVSSAMVRYANLEEALESAK